MEAEIRKLSKRRGGDDDDSEDEKKKKKPKVSYLEVELGKYASSRGIKKKGKRKDEGDILDALNAFRGKLQSALPDDPEDEEGPDKELTKITGDAVEKPESIQDFFAEDPGMEIDDDRDFLGHALRFPKDDGEESRKAERDYEVIDPRQRGARAKEEERARKAKAKYRDGGRGSRGSRGGGGNGGGGGGGDNRRR